MFCNSAQDDVDTVTVDDDSEKNVVLKRNRAVTDNLPHTGTAITLVDLITLHESKNILCNRNYIIS